jgi:hypothetical protein
MEQLLPVIVGGLIGLAGGIAGPPLSHWLNEASSNKKKRAEKLEDMIGHIYAHDHWLNLIRGVRAYGEQDSREPTPLPKASAIAAIYFPQFVPALSELNQVTAQYELWMFGAAKKRLEGNIKELNDGHPEAYEPYMRKREDVLSKMREFAALEFALKPRPWRRSKKVE